MSELFSKYCEEGEPVQEETQELKEDIQELDEDSVVEEDSLPYMDESKDSVLLNNRNPITPNNALFRPKWIEEDV